MKKNSRTLFSNTILFAIGSLGTKLIQFFLVPLYTNVLTTSEYGLVELIFTSTILIIPFITLALDDSILRFTLDKKSNNNDVLKNASMVLILSTIVLLVLYPILSVLEVFGIWLPYFIIITILQIFRSALSVYLKGIDKIKVFTLDSIIYTINFALLNIIMLLILKWGIKGYFLAQICAMLISLIFIILVSGVYKNFINSKVDIKLLKQMVLYSTPLIVNAVSWWILNASDRYMIGYIKSTNDVGLYAVAAKMPSFVTTFTSIFTQAWVISSITEYEEKRDEKFYSRIFSLYSLMLIIISSMVVTMIKPFMGVYVGNNFTGAWIYVPFLILAAVFYTTANFFMALYKSAKKNINETSVTLLGAILNIILNLVMIPIYGIMGAVVATLISNVFMAVFCLFDTRKFFSFYIDFKRLLPSVLILFGQVIMITKGINSYMISVICLLLILMINRKSIMEILLFLKKYLFLRIIKLIKS